jgi:hypothetical protein
VVWSRNEIFHWTWQPGLKIALEHCGPLPMGKALPPFFLCIFCSLTYLKKPVSSKRDLLQWKVPASLSLCLKSEKNPSSASRRKRTWVQALTWHPTYSLGPTGVGTYLKSQKGLSPSTIDNLLLPCWREVTLSICNVGNVPQFALLNLGFKFLWPKPKLQSFWWIRHKNWKKKLAFCWIWPTCLMEASLWELSPRAYKGQRIKSGLNK